MQTINNKEHLTLSTGSRYWSNLHDTFIFMSCFIFNDAVPTENVTHCWMANERLIM